ncbi:Alpha/Beta hydrolase protein [Aspergillus keveii]|uniref:Alpha/Beta hydrolase protein n=1 Tax=Aspergillus keveii TaxID=714993 RepID=A0ABR4FJ29_9EURO
MTDRTSIQEASTTTKRLGKFIPGWDPRLVGTQAAKPRRLVADGLVQDLDIAIPVCDGTILRGNIFRAEKLQNDKLPVILNYSVYGKDGAIDICVFPPSAGLDPTRISKYYLFEAADPGWWCERGYAVVSVDVRGSQQSDGDKGYYSKDVGLDGYDVIEWLATQPWSNGKVALYGASGYAMVTWLVAAERPPSLAAIIPIDGMTDIYREMAFKGGIPEKQFNEIYPFFWNFGRNLIDDSLYGREHPFFGEYWQSKIPALEQIECPAYIICSWGDHGIHTRGTLNAWKKISSTEKYLEIHQCQKWEWAVTEESLTRQKAFLDRYLRDDEDTEVRFWPKVRYAMRERYYTGEWRSSTSFPIDNTQYTKYFLTPSNGLSRVAAADPHSLSYHARTGEAAFELPILDTTLEFAGHAKLRLWVEAQGADNLDLFITLRKIDRNGNPVYFPWLTVADTGPIGFGWMRVSRRELDERSSTDHQPVHLHQRDLPLSPGEIVPVDIEIQPTSCRLRSGERLQLFVSGHDYGTFPANIPVARHPDTVNHGSHILHFGGKYDSHLQLPIIPSADRSYANSNKAIKMAVVATRLPGWTDEAFLKEYTRVHAGMTKSIAAEVSVLRNYTQVVALPLPDSRGFSTIATDSKGWDCATILGWSTLRALWGSFKSPDYQASAGNHVFVDESSSVGLLAVPDIDTIFDPISLEQSAGNGAMAVFFLARGSNIENLEGDIRDRANAVQAAATGSSLLRYVINKAVTPQNPKTFFADTPFTTADWTTMIAMEQYWFPNMRSAVEFFGNAKQRQPLEALPSSFDWPRSISIIGAQNTVVKKDIGF